MRKIICLVMTVLMLLSIAGCGAKETEPAIGNKVTEIPVTEPETEEDRLFNGYIGVEQVSTVRYHSYLKMIGENNINNVPLAKNFFDIGDFGLAYFYNKGEDRFKLCLTKGQDISVDFVKVSGNMPQNTVDRVHWLHGKAPVWNDYNGGDFVAEYDPSFFADSKMASVKEEIYRDNGINGKLYIAVEDAVYRYNKKGAIDGILFFCNGYVATLEFSQFRLDFLSETNIIHRLLDHTTAPAAIAEFNAKINNLPIAPEGYIAPEVEFIPETEDDSWWWQLIINSLPEHYYNSFDNYEEYKAFVEENNISYVPHADRFAEFGTFDNVWFAGKGTDYMYYLFVYDELKTNIGITLALGSSSVDIKDKIKNQKIEFNSRYDFLGNNNGKDVVVDFDEALFIDGDMSFIRPEVYLQNNIEGELFVIFQNTAYCYNSYGALTEIVLYSENHRVEVSRCFNNGKALDPTHISAQLIDVKTASAAIAELREMASMPTINEEDIPDYSDIISPVE